MRDDDKLEFCWKKAEFWEICDGKADVPNLRYAVSERQCMFALRSSMAVFCGTLLFCIRNVCTFGPKNVLPLHLNNHRYYPRENAQCGGMRAIETEVGYWQLDKTRD